MNNSRPQPWKPESEQALCAPCVERWSDEADVVVHQERALYEGGPAVDIVVKRESTGEVHAFEAKRSLTLKVVAQAFRHRTHASSWWIIVPASTVAKKTADLEETLDVLRALRIGVITVAGPERQHVNVWQAVAAIKAPVFASPATVAAVAASIPTAEAGTQAAGSSGGGREGPEASTLASLRSELADFPGGAAKLATIVHVIKHHWPSDKVATRELRQLLTKRGAPGLRYRGGQVSLAD